MENRRKQVRKIIDYLLPQCVGFFPTSVRKDKQHNRKMSKQCNRQFTEKEISRKFILKKLFSQSNKHELNQKDVIPYPEESTIFEGMTVYSTSKQEKRSSLLSPYKRTKCHNCLKNTLAKPSCLTYHVTQEILGIQPT